MNRLFFVIVFHITERPDVARVLSNRVAGQLAVFLALPILLVLVLLWNAKLVRGKIDSRLIL